MKVLVVGTGGAIVSGITTAADELVRTLEAEGHAVVRVAAGTVMRKRPNTLNPANVLAVATDAVAVSRAARRTRADVVWLDVFGVPALPALRALALALGGRFARSRVVVRFHAFGLEEEVASGGRLLRILLRSIGRVAHRLVAVHEAAAAALRSAGPKAPVVALPNWIAVPAEAPVLPAGPPWVAVFVGGIVRRKGAPELVGAAKLLEGSDVWLRLVGGPAEDGEEAFSQVRSAADDVVASGRLVFVGELDGDGVRRELDGAHVFVLPSEAEGMPIAMVEAMARGRPIVVTAVGNMGEVVATHRCGLVLDGREPATIAAALRDLMADRGALEAMGKRAHAAALASYSEVAAAARIDAILASTRAG